MSLYVLERADPRQLSANVTSSSGRVFRWGSDESDAGNVPSGIVITTQMPGGFGTLDCSLQRRPDVTYADFDRFAPVTCTGAGGALTAFDGYLSSRPMSRGDTYSFSPEAIGWSGHLKDDTSFSMVYIDRQLSKWTGPSTARQLALLGSRNTAGMSTQAQADSLGNPEIFISGQGPLAGTPQSEVWYDSGANNLIGRLQFSDVAMTTTYGGADANALVACGTSSDDHATAFVQLFNISGGGDHGAQGGATTSFRYAIFLHYYNSAASSGSAGSLYGAEFKNPAVIGNHGLTLRTGPSGTSPGTDDGFYGGDIVTDIVTRAAPKLSVSRGNSGYAVYNDTFVVPNLAFNTPVSADTAVQQLNQYYLYDYGVYENRAFFWQPPGSGRVWRLRVGDGVKLQDQGPQIETAFNGVVVQYLDPAGHPRYVGPPGYSGDRDPVTGVTSSSLLQDTSSSNPCNAYGRKRWALLQMGTTTWQGAVTVGSVFLATAGSRPSSGTATATGFARDSNGRDWPVWMIRAGDTVIFGDTNDQTPRYILNTSYNHENLTNTLTLDAPPNKLDWILQRLGLAISAIG